MSSTQSVWSRLLGLIGNVDVAGVFAVDGDAEDSAIDRPGCRKGDRALHRSNCDHKSRVADSNLVTVDYADDSLPCDGLEFLSR